MPMPSSKNRIAMPSTRYLDLSDMGLQFEMDGANGRLLGWGYYVPEWWRNYLHSHSFFELCYVYQGEGSFHLDGAEHPLKQHDLVIARPNRKHEMISSQRDPLGIYFWAFSLFEKPTLFEDDGASLWHGLLNGRVSKVPAPSLQQTLQLIADEMNTFEVGFHDATTGLFKKLAIDCARLLSDTAQKAHSKPILPNMNSSIVKQIIHFLHDNYPLDLTMRDISAQAHLSERHLNRLFQRDTGQTVMSYLTELRLNQAKQQLLETNLMIHEIGQRVGVENGRYFATLFRKHIGCSPKQFRQNKGTIFQ